MQGRKYLLQKGCGSKRKYKKSLLLISKRVGEKVCAGFGSISDVSNKITEYCTYKSINRRWRFKGKKGG